MVDQDIAIDLPVFCYENRPIFYGFPEAKLAELFENSFRVHFACSLQSFSELLRYSAIKLDRHSIDPIFYRSWFTDDSLVFNWQHHRIGANPLLVSISLARLLNIKKTVDLQYASGLPLSYFEPAMEHFEAFNDVGLKTSFLRSVFPSASLDCFANHAWLPINVERDVIRVSLDPRLSNDLSIRVMRHVRASGFKGGVQRSDVLSMRQARDGCFLNNRRAPYEKAKRVNIFEELIDKTTYPPSIAQLGCQNGYG
jgi:hypothetical protein